jgi:hypothetical protein
VRSVIESIDLGNPCTVVIHVGTTEFRPNGHLDYVMGDAYDLVNGAKVLTSRVVLSGALGDETCLGGELET